MLHSKPATVNKGAGSTPVNVHNAHAGASRTKKNFPVGNASGAGSNIRKTGIDQMDAKRRKRGKMY